MIRHNYLGLINNIHSLLLFEANDDFDHIVVSSSNGDNDDYIVADGESIELNEAAVTDLLLQLPTKNLCKDDCKGLCMVCGCDLNESYCDHIDIEL